MATINSINNTIPVANLTVVSGNLYVGTTAPANPYRISIEESVAGLTGQSIQNTSSNAAAGVNIQHIVEVGAADAFSLYSVNGGGTWSLGLDNSDSDSLKITTGSSPSAGTEVLLATSAGVVTMNGGAVNIGTNNASNTITIGTGTSARLINIGRSAAAHIVQLGVNNGVSSTSIEAGTGNMTINSGGTIGITATSTIGITASNSAVTINSGTGALSVSNDAAATTVEIATGGGVKTTTLGSTNTTSATTIQSGTGGVSLTTTANANITLSPGGSGTVSVTAAPIVPTTDRADSLGSTTNSWDNVYCDGVSFDDGTNILSTYVAPTAWTPVITFGGGSTGLTYTTQQGKYSRIGNVVFINFTITLSAKGTSTGIALITGFPVSAAGTPTPRNTIAFASTALASGVSLGIALTGTSANVERYVLAGALVQLSDTEFTDTTSLRGELTYFV
jgi:hypothetical protein